MTQWSYQVALLCPDPDQGDALIVAATQDPNQIGSFLREEAAPGWYGAGGQITQSLVEALLPTPAEACLYWVYHWENGPLVHTNHAPSQPHLGEIWDWRRTLAAMA
jgi:hypothetical protein